MNNVFKDYKNCNVEYSISNITLGGNINIKIDSERYVTIALDEVRVFEIDENDNSRFRLVRRIPCFVAIDDSGDVFIINENKCLNKAIIPTHIKKAFEDLEKIIPNLK